MVSFERGEDHRIHFFDHFFLQISLYFSSSQNSFFFYSIFSLVTMTSRDGRISRLENVYLRGGNIKFIVLPELLKSAPIFKKVQTMRTKKVGDMDLNGGRGGRGDGGRGGGRGGRGRDGGRGGGRGRN